MASTLTWLQCDLHEPTTHFRVYHAQCTHTHTHTHTHTLSLSLSLCVCVCLDRHSPDSQMSLCPKRCTDKGLYFSAVDGSTAVDTPAVYAASLLKTHWAYARHSSLASEQDPPHTPSDRDPSTYSIGYTAPIDDGCFNQLTVRDAHTFRAFLTHADQKQQTAHCFSYRL